MNSIRRLVSAITKVLNNHAFFDAKTSLTLPYNMTLNILSMGGSRNIGYFASLRFLAAGATVTFLLRSLAIFEKDEDIQKYVKSGQVLLLKGDAMVQQDVRRAWEEAGKFGNIDLLLFTVGGTPKFSLTRGFIIETENLVTQSLLNALITMPKIPDHEPRIIVISAIGITSSSHKALPMPLKPLYAMIAVPHRDKLCAERVIAHCAGWDWDTKKDGEPSQHLLGPGDFRMREGLPEAGSLKKVLVIRPAMLNDGECLAEQPGSKKYRVSTNDLSGYFVSRKDVAHFIADAVLNRWDEYENKKVDIAY